MALPSVAGSAVVVAAPGPGAGSWAGAPSAVLVDGVFWLAHRVRRPLDEGRGVAVVVSRSSDGVRFEEVASVGREAFGAASLERPALVALPGGGWRLYLSCATPGSRHWWVEALDAEAPGALASGRRAVVLPGGPDVGVKDPVVVIGDDGTWHLWLCCHPLDVPGHEDRMTTRHLTSADGLTWADAGEVLAGTPGTWDARGARVTAVVSTDPLVVLYDGRPTADDNWFERTGVARGVGGGGVAARLVADPDGPAARSPEGDGALRYACAVPLPDGSTRWYAEAARTDGSHDLITSVSPAPGQA